ncbi:hypothetical protein GUJ93_ZPchr0005g16110 [Zizania palustris]|uniref:Leucine-rich repeat-containing N-terminal plant-type domain-containing protein n=1 Tax=Zizania palustris TaxID=103762 RepID=A0A8J5SRK6_ZIZPA|nr:hypothetical protein GUJ93_ZPchr0005g16110 [Zizania palustris]
MTALAAALTGLLLALAAVAEADTDAADGNATAPRPGSVPNQGFGRHAGVSSLAVRAKESDDFSALASEKPAEPAPAKREAWKGFGREMSNGDDEVQMQGESASWNVLNHIGVELSSMRLNGTLGYQLSNLQALKTMDLSSNNLHDSIPYQLPPNLTYLNLAGNTFSGNIQFSISNMVSLDYLNLSHNLLFQEIGELFGNLNSLSEL